MACALWTFDSVKNMIASQKISEQTLAILKRDFADEIGSRRRVACINSLADLLDILERRDVINEANISALEDICNFLGNEELIEALSQYVPVEQYDYENEYALERIQNEIQERMLVEERKSGEIKRNGPSETNPQTQASNSPEAPLVLAGKKRDKVYDLIATEIGRKWRDFGREIGMREGEMDNLETDYPRNSKAKVRKMLELFEEDEKVEPNKIVFCICTALENCRRRDLSRTIHEILMR